MELPKIETQIQEQKADIILQKVEELLKDEASKGQSQQIGFFTILLAFSSTADRIAIGFGYLLAAAFGIVTPIYVVFMGEIINSLDGSLESTQNIIDYCVILLYIALFGFVVSAIYFVLLEQVGQKVSVRIRTGYLKAVLRQDVGWFEMRNPLELQTKMVMQCQSVDRMTGRLMGVMIQVTFASIFGIVYSAYLSFTYTVLLLLYFPLFFMIVGALMRQTQVGHRLAMKSQSQSAGFAEQAIQAIKVVAAYGQEVLEIQTYSRLLQATRQQGEEAARLQTWSQVAFVLALSLFSMYTLIVGAILLLAEVKDINGEVLSGGDIVACYNAVIIGVFGFFAIFPMFKTLGEGKAAAYEIFQILERRPQIDLHEQKMLMDEKCLRGRVEFRNVSFSFKGNRVLHDFSLVFQEGATTALVGRSGAGKSTIISLIERFYDVQAGEVAIDGVDVRDLNLKSLREMVGYVGQEPVLFNTTIRENMLYAKPDATECEIQEALMKASIYEFVETLSEGLDTQVGSKGASLSGGQRQRISIARALLKKPKILLLDEATSSLDLKNERVVQEAITTLKQELDSITIIVIAHRLQTIFNSDLIIVLDKGQILEQGTHDFLRHQGGLYSELLREQATVEKQSELNLPEPASLRKHSSSRQWGGEESEGLLSEEGSRTEMSIFEEREAELKREEEENAKQVEGLFKKMLRLSEMGDRRKTVKGFVGSMMASVNLPCGGLIFGTTIFILMGFYGPDITSLLIIELAGMFLLVIFVIISQFISKRNFGLFGLELSYTLREKLYRQILRKHASWFEEPGHSSGVLTSIMAKDTSMVNVVASDTIGVLTEGTCCVLVAVVLASIFSWQMALVSLALGPLNVVGLALMQMFQARSNRHISERQKQSNLLAGDVISNYREVAALANYQAIVYDFEGMVVQAYDGNWKNILVSAFVFALSNFSRVFASAVLFLVMALVILAVEDVFTPDLYIAQIIILLSLMNFYTVSQFAAEVGQASASSDRIFRILDNPSLIDPLLPEQAPSHPASSISLTQAISPLLPTSSIEFKNVWFRYPQRKDCWVLRNFSLKIKAKESVALLGESGCGKSTVMQLLLRLYDVDRGQILVGGTDIRYMPLGELRRGMGYVPQDSTLFNYSLYENILYGKMQASNSELLQAAKRAYVLDFIDSVDDTSFLSGSIPHLKEQLLSCRDEVIRKTGSKRYDELLRGLEQAEAERMTEFSSQVGLIDYRPEQKKDVQLREGFFRNCGVKGSRLSGGQKQRVAIARALVRAPKILLLDEATSALDEESQRIVQKAVEELMLSRTTLVIAHRASTIEKCEKVVLMSEGTVVEVWKKGKDKKGEKLKEFLKGHQ